MDMIEKVMEAIAPGCHSEHCGDIDRYEIERMARAAIEAMRDLTDEMFDAGAGSIYGFPRDKAEQWAKEDKFDGAGYQAQNAWQAMLTAALNSSPSKSNPSPKAAQDQTEQSPVESSRR